MKNILVPIGSSFNALNTLQYAIDFAEAVEAKIYLVHIYSSPKISGNILKVDQIMERDSKEILKDHLNNVKRIIPAENLLVFDVKEGWEPLCRFLGVSEPARPFPHLNDRQMMKIFLWMIRATTVIVPLVLILLVAFLAWQIVF